MEPVIHLRDAVVVLGRFPALAGATLRVDRGEIVLLQGPNGAGKTTLLRLCAGLVPVIRGEAVVLGLDLTKDRRAVRHQVGLLGHGNGLYDDLSVTENVRFWGRTVGARDAEIDAALTRLGLAGRLADTPVARLSAGQRRRTALAALVARRPELWLLDEPHAGLDADGRDLVDELLRTAADAGATVLVASHEQDRAGGLARRTVRVAGGQVDDPSGHADATAVVPAEDSASDALPATDPAARAPATGVSATDPAARAPATGVSATDPAARAPATGVTAAAQPDADPASTTRAGALPC